MSENRFVSEKLSFVRRVRVQRRTSRVERRRRRAARAAPSPVTAPTSWSPCARRTSSRQLHVPRAGAWAVARRRTGASRGPDRACNARGRGRWPSTAACSREPPSLQSRRRPNQTEAASIHPCSWPSPARSSFCGRSGCASGAWPPRASCRARSERRSASAKRARLSVTLGSVSTQPPPSQQSRLLRGSNPRPHPPPRVTRLAARLACGTA
mmetsp:Transcript_3634/g.16674  ORF Transcript_3634/g.16674 Transcript_3634/m.16674 type:complete len:211 (-) Transcript_3634:441-1073(-)